MQRIESHLPEFTRSAWVSEKAHSVWAPRLHAIASAWTAIEWRSVAVGVRPCCLTSVSPAMLPELSAEWLNHSLIAVPLAKVRNVGHSYLNSMQPPAPGESFDLRMVVGRAADVTEFSKAWASSDNNRIGELLGYPRCCRDFFGKVWIAERCLDTTWAMGLNSCLPSSGTTALEVQGSPYANMLWRWIGPRAVPHLPCSFSCKPSIDFGKQLFELGCSIGFSQQVDWLLEVLSWPVEWTALHGVAEIKNPIMRTSTRTDATAVKYTLRWLSDTLPREAQSGLSYPYNKANEQPAFDEPISPDELASTPWVWTDNGFATRTAMEEAHEVLVRSTARVLLQRPGAVLDLGCGNAHLLARIAEEAPSCQPHGIELDAMKVERAKTLLPYSRQSIIARDIFDQLADLWPGKRFSLALFMPGRLFEAPAEKTAPLVAMLAARCDRVLAYAYGDWRDRFDMALRPLIEAGFELADHIMEHSGVRFVQLTAPRSAPLLLDEVSHADTPHADHRHQDVWHDDFHADEGGWIRPHYDTHNDQGHKDVPHADENHSDSGPGHNDSYTPHHDSGHGDVPYQDTSHVDTRHVDSGWGPWHDDVLHGDSNRKDTPHTDSNHADVPTHHDAHDDHNDTARVHHSDMHFDHNDAHVDRHNDYHGDEKTPSAPHQDENYQDSHGDGWPHVDTHVDETKKDPHSDTHNDHHVDKYEDHADVPRSHFDHGHIDHTDAHRDYHSDIGLKPHVDSHSDQHHDHHDENPGPNLGMKLNPTGYLASRTELLTRTSVDQIVAQLKLQKQPLAGKPISREALVQAVTAAGGGKPSPSEMSELEYLVQAWIEYSGQKR